MSISSVVVSAEKISDTEYKLTTEHYAEYYYKCIDTRSESFLSQEESWRNLVMNGQQLLLDWIEYQSDKSPAYIYWNYEKRAMLDIKTPSQSFDSFRCEINPFECKGEEWVIDPECLF
jgi:hypothetical protein